MNNLVLRPYQSASIESLRDGFRNNHIRQVLAAPTGAGKCLGVDTPVLMADGSIKPVQDVRAGDRLASPTGGVRIVQSTTRGTAPLYRVTPTKGDSYVVNDAHILSLKKTPGSGWLNTPNQHIPKDADLVTVSAEEYANSNATTRHCLKGWRAPVLAFENQPGYLPMPAYILGLWLGDGDSRRPTLTKPCGPIIDAWCEYGASIGLGCKEGRIKDGCSSWALTNGRQGPHVHNMATGILSDLGVLNNKHIPALYLRASFDDRAALVAGLLDTDGHATHSGYDWISVSELLAQQMAFLCRSIGLACYINQVTKSIKSLGFSGTYWRLSISGDASFLPTLQKHVQPRLQKKRVLVHGIKVEPIGEGEYFGFELDGDRLFMLGDFTVTHNSRIMESMIRAAKEKGSRILFVCERRILVDQFSNHLQAAGIDHGVLMAKHWRFRPYEKVQIASAQTLEAMGSIPAVDIVFVDELHACFVAGTLIDGKPIESIKVGDYVNSFNHETGSVEQRRVTATFVHKADKLVTVKAESGESFTCTEDHPIFTQNGYVKANSLSHESVLRLINHQQCSCTGAGCAEELSTWSSRVASVEVQKPGSFVAGGTDREGGKFVDVFNIEVEGNHNYFANEVLVHNCMRASIIKMIVNHPNLRIVGATATPFHPAIGKHFTNVVSVTTMAQLVEEKFLVPFRVFIAKEIDTKGLKVVAGEWKKDDLEKRGQQIIGDVVSDYIRISNDVFGGYRKTICFSCGIAHGAELAQKFQESGINAVQISSEDNEDYRDEVLKDFARPDSEIKILISVAILSRGFDQSDIDYVILARPLKKSFSEHVQMIGRGARIHPGKEICTVQDNSGNWLRFADEWDKLYNNNITKLLDGQDEKPKKEPTDAQKEAAKCPKCSVIWGGGDTCAHCGHVRVKRNEVVAVAGEIVEIDATTRKPEKYSPEFKADFYAQLLGFAEEKGHKPGSAWHRYKERFGVGPSMAKPQPKPPGIAVRDWITSQNIRKAKAQGKLL